MNAFKEIVFKLQLYSTENKRVETLPLFVQYYSFADQKWITIYRDEVSKGVFYVKGSAESKVKTRNPFFDLLRDGYIPPVRLIPTEKIYSGKKKEVVGTTFTFSLNQKTGIFEFDFGTLWLASKEWVEKYTDTFPDFVSVASFFPFSGKPGRKDTLVTTPPIKEIPDRETETIDYAKELSAYKEQLETAARRYDLLKTSAEQQNKDYNSLIQQKTDLEAQLRTEKENLRDQKLYVLELENKIDILSREKPLERTSVPIKNLYTNIVSEIETATRATSGTSSFKLSNVSLKLKAIVQQNGDSLSASLLDITDSEKVNGNSISELSFDIAPVNNTEGESIVTPDVTGLTETAVRRVLESLNLRLNPVYQNHRTVVNGDSFKQSPVRGTSIQPNQLVTVIFSKNERQHEQQ